MHEELIKLFDTPFFPRFTSRKNITIGGLNDKSYSQRRSSRTCLYKTKGELVSIIERKNSRNSHK